MNNYYYLYNDWKSTKGVNCFKKSIFVIFATNTFSAKYTKLIENCKINLRRTVVFFLSESVKDLSIRFSAQCTLQL